MVPRIFSQPSGALPATAVDMTPSPPAHDKENITASVTTIAIKCFKVPAPSVLLDVIGFPLSHEEVKLLRSIRPSRKIGLLIDDQKGDLALHYRITLRVRLRVNEAFDLVKKSAEQDAKNALARFIPSVCSALIEIC